MPAQTQRHILSKMPYPKLVYALYYELWFSLLTIPTVLEAAPIHHVCSSPSFINAKDPFKYIQNELIRNLRSRSSPCYGKAGQAYGLTPCRRDIEGTTGCTNCIRKASREICRRCPTNKRAIIWYNECCLKYSNEDFYGLVDYQNDYFTCNLKTTNTSERFNQKKSSLLNSLAFETFLRVGYATGHIGVDSSGTLYAMVQCTNDIYPNECNDCLQHLFETDKKNCGGKEGGRIGTGSCNLRYETPFCEMNSLTHPVIYSFVCNIDDK